MNGKKQMSFALNSNFFSAHPPIFLKREERRKNKLIRLIKIFLLLIFLSATAFGLKALAEAVLNWDFLKIKKFQIINPPIYSMQQVHSIISRQPENILALDLQSLKNELLALPEIKSVSMNKIMPSSVEIRFELEKPVFQIEISKKEYQIVAENGKIIACCSVLQPELMILKNITPETLPLIIEQKKELEPLFNRLEYISYQKPFGLILKLRECTELILVGRENFSKKIDLYLQVKKELPANSEKIIKADLRFNNRFYLEFLPGGVNEG